jgi:hypothetical protein
VAGGGRGRPPTVRLAVLSLCAAAALAVGGCGVAVRGVAGAATSVANSGLFHTGRHGALTDTEREWAKSAWSYFAKNKKGGTSLVSSTAQGPSVSMWNVADYLAALVAARGLDIINDQEFDNSLSAALGFLNDMRLFRGRLPNKVYNAENGATVDYANQPAEIGWSAVDIGRLLIWLGITKARYPRYAEYVDRVVLGWDFCDVVGKDRFLYGAEPAGDKLNLHRETDRGYEDYAAIGYRLWGFDIATPPRPATVVPIHGIGFGSDERPGRLEPVMTGPSVLAGLEFHWDPAIDKPRPSADGGSGSAADLAERVYEVQELRHEKAGIATARSDYRRSSDPYYVYDTILAAGQPWNVLGSDGRYQPHLALVSTGAALGMWALWNTRYTDTLARLVEGLRNGDQGWVEGRYEDTGGYEWTISSATNAVILEALLHKVQGELYRPRSGGDVSRLIRSREFGEPDRCLPGAKRQDAAATPARAAGR